MPCDKSISFCLLQLLIVVVEVSSSYFLHDIFQSLDKRVKCRQSARENLTSCGNELTLVTKEFMDKTAEFFNGDNEPVVEDEFVRQLREERKFRKRFCCSFWAAKHCAIDELTKINCGDNNSTSWVVANLNSSFQIEARLYGQACQPEFYEGSERCKLPVMAIILIIFACLLVLVCVIHVFCKLMKCIKGMCKSCRS